MKSGVTPKNLKDSSNLNIDSAASSSSDVWDVLCCPCVTSASDSSVSSDYNKDNSEVWDVICC